MIQFPQVQKLCKHIIFSKNHLDTNTWLLQSHIKIIWRISQNIGV